MIYPDDFIDKIICGDCLEVMKEIPDKSVNLVLTDPPYGIKESNEKNKTRGKYCSPKDYGHYDWDKQKVKKEYFEEIRRVSKNQVIFGGNYYASILGDSSCWLVWDKDNGKNDFSDCELAWTSFKTAVRKFKWRWNGMLQEDMKNKEKRVHPTQKPLPLFKWILEKYSQPNDIILDPFLGSGTTALACLELNRHFIGIELSPEYCEIARNRISKIQPQLVFN
jgi:site-specific DNA-methyltransferase (adenine-specific)